MVSWYFVSVILPKHKCQYKYSFTNEKWLANLLYGRVNRLPVQACIHAFWLAEIHIRWLLCFKAKRLVTNPTSATKNLRDLISGTTRNAKCEFRGIIRMIFVAMMWANFIEPKTRARLWVNVYKKVQPASHSDLICTWSLVSACSCNIYNLMPLINLYFDF